jgi:hypothetical protein
LRLSNGELFNHDQFAFFCVSIDHNRAFDISWQLAVRHQVAVTALALTNNFLSVDLRAATDPAYFLACSIYWRTNSTDFLRGSQYLIAQSLTVLTDIETRLEAHCFFRLTDKLFVLDSEVKACLNAATASFGEFGVNSATRLRFWLAIFAAFRASYLIPVGALPKICV